MKVWTETASEMKDVWADQYRIWISRKEGEYFWIRQSEEGSVLGYGGESPK